MNNTRILASVLSEKIHLDEKIGKLEAFLEDDIKVGELSSLQQTLLKRQLVAMTSYSYILLGRIKDTAEHL